MSARALCRDCAAERNAEQKDQIREQSGPHYEAYRAGIIDYARRLARQ